jgi:hypothetical protein
VSESLLRDLSRSRLFPQVVSANDPASAPLELSGHVFRCALERSGTISRAALHVEVSLINSETLRRVIFRREYDLRSPPFVEENSVAFARAMSGLMREFSEKFQQNLCTVLASPKEQIHELK